MSEEVTTADRWDPDQYSKFSAERARPFFDLLSMLEPVPGPKVIDLGCGTGELTSRLHAHVEASSTLGMDSSEAMLAKARPLSGNGLTFEAGNISDFAEEAAFDVIFSNAALHWVPDHPRVLARLTRGLRPGGQLAVQVPANADHPSHAIADELAREEGFSEYVGNGLTAHAVSAPERYAELLDELGFAEQQVRLQVYGHHLDSTAAVVEWTKGTTLLRFRELLPPEKFDVFVDRYQQRVIEVLGNQAPYFYTFKRILFWARMT
jgi:trans-aconitate 2-methyltransferase